MRRRISATGPVPRWTWRLTQEAYDEMADSIRGAVRKTGDDHAIRRVISELLGMPGFRGVRQQIRGLIGLIHAEWRRARKTEHCPYISTRPKGYLQFIELRRLPLAFVADRMTRGLKAIPPEMIRPAGAGDGGADTDRVTQPAANCPLPVDELRLPPEVYGLFTQFKQAAETQSGRRIPDDDILSHLIARGLSLDRALTACTQQR